jgi:polyphosphate kinase
MSKKNVELINREISWLSFNERVLQEAEDPAVPLIERLKFLGIFSNNRDEFFRVRVATVKRMVKLSKKAKDVLGEDPTDLLDRIHKIVIDQQDRFDRAYHDIIRDLAAHHIFIINEKQLTPEQGEVVRNHFRSQVLPSLVPIMIDHTAKFPYLKDKSSYLIIKLVRYEKGKKSRYALVEVPTPVLSRFFVLPSTGSTKYIILLDDVIRFCLDDIFSIFEYDAVEAYTIKLTRDAELDIDNDVSKSIVEKISGGVKKRKKGQPVRLVYDSAIAKDMLQMVMKKIKLRKEDNPIPGGRYHNFKDFMNFPKLDIPELYYQNPPALPHPGLEIKKSIFDALRKKDVLLTYPYQSFHHVIDMLREASIDPKVQSIHITLYRVAKNSNVVNALINAIKNGKLVTVVMEIQARFDEENNIYWANKLQEEGAKVIYGVPGLKVHSKCFLITRKEGKKQVLYAHVGTGNFNEVTSRVYSDHSVLTADPRITGEVQKLFQFYEDNLKLNSYKHLVISPFIMRKKFTNLINKEMANARAGKEAYIILKMNSIVDREMIRHLYEASQAGVKIKLIIRGICSLVSGVEGLSDNIEAISIVDKYLEHARVFIFCSGGAEKYFISSADWMTRNLDHRSEVAVPIYDKRIQKELRDIIDIQLKDNTKARILNKKQNNKYKVTDSPVKVRAQDYTYEYLKRSGEKEKIPNINKAEIVEIRSN